MPEVIPNCGQKTGKREAAWALFRWTVAAYLFTEGAEILTGAELTNLRSLTTFLATLAGAFMLGAYSIAAVKQAGLIGGPK